MSDRLHQLLSVADDAAPPRPTTGDLVRVVYRRGARQRRVRRAVAAAAVIAVVVLPWLMRTSPKPAEVAIAPQPQRPTLMAAPVDVAALDLQAQLHEQVAARLLAARTGRRRDVKPAAHDPILAELQQQRDRAALLLVYEADQYRRRNLAGEAVASYRRAIELFPQTHWAEVARQRLKDL